MIEIDILTIEYINGVLSFNYTIDGMDKTYKKESIQNGWTIDELKELTKKYKKQINIVSAFSKIAPL